MELIFPAHRLVYSDKEYYVSIVKLGLVYKLFIDSINETEKLEEDDIVELKDHILENKDNPLIINMVVFFDNDYDFSTVEENNDYGYLKLSLMKNNFYTHESNIVKISLGRALAQEKKLKEQNITVTFFPVEDTKNMYNLIFKLDDVSSYSKKINNNVESLKNNFHKESEDEIMDYLFYNFEHLRELVDTKNTSLSLRSKYLFTLNAIKETNNQLLENLILDEEEKKKLVLEFWLHLFKVFSEWDRYRASEIREKFIHSSLLAIRAIAGFSSQLILNNKNYWKNYLDQLKKIDWSKENNIWFNIGVLRKTDSSIISSIEAKNNLISYLEEKLKIESKDISPDKIFSLIEEEYLNVYPYISFNKRNDGNISVKGKNKVFCYIDFFDHGRMVVARLKINPYQPELENYQGLWRKSTVNHQIGTWGTNIIDVPIISSKKINEYIEIMEIGRKLNNF